ncbi:glycoside hydrolase family 3 protein [Pseudomaricurvus alcaniphilus]|uniref:glycoside hydrolase family 3 protein n=1 Tax=Pseudomaricurvus alcaniphilus TaxID=1166482 RepID=UPI00140A9996|nr:glycoside hydrolase family 3 N-terminal domain-containing protein [Pseudomaricurvus alcaniphilus]NHN35781.1 glycoside hydrolase family 3 protein [Pseudomaricurvus alcaniphilus]
MIVGAALLSSCSDDKASATVKDTVTEQQQPLLGYRSAEILEVGGLQFKDLNRNLQLDPYEDWRRPLQQRIDDLVGRMTPKEKAGMMLIQTLNSAPGGALPEDATRFIQDEYMTRFIFRNPVVPEPDPSLSGGFSGAQITPEQAAEYMNRIQALAESTRLGIPVVFKSNARNHYEQDARPGINLSAGSFSTWPKEAGLAATRDMALVAEFAEVMRQEWTSIGLRGMYGYMADLSTEPRWYRVHETFTEDADLAADMITTLVKTLQGEQLNPGSVALTIKHFPGGGPQSGGGDPHYWFGRNQAYPANNFDYHLKPFQAAINTGASSIMAYYGVPVGQAHQPNDVGMAFSKGIVTDLLRNKLGFKGYVNSDTGIIGEPGANRAWGLEGKSVEELLVTAIEAGTDVLSGFNNHQQILGLVHNGMVTQARVDQSVARLLKEQYMLGLFENPYVDPAVAVATVGKKEFQARAALAQRKSIVLLQNSAELLPLQTPTAEAPIGVYTLGMSADAVRAAGYRVTTGDHGSEAPRPPVPADTRYALIRVNVSNPVSSLEEFANEPMPFPGVEPATIFGGARPDELDFLAFSDMVSKKSWKISPSLPDIKAVMDEVGAENTVLSIYFRQPYVLDSASGLQQAGAILGLFGADDAALMDVLTGKYNPSGKLPFALANSANAILEQASDAPGYAPEDTLYPFGFGLSY